MMPFVVLNHILPETIHGGYDDAASLTLWLDEAAGVAHLTGHSGSSTPLAGPEALSGAPSFEVIGRSGHVAEFYPDYLEELRAELEIILKDWKVGADNAIVSERIIEELDDVDLMQWTYSDWTADNEPETHAELYGEVVDD